MKTPWQSTPSRSLARDGRRELGINAIATGIAFGLGVVGALLLLGGIGALVFAVAGLTAPTLAYVGLGSLVFVVGVLTLAGANAFFWTYWTLAYLRLSGHAAPTAAA